MIPMGELVFGAMFFKKWALKRRDGFSFSEERRGPGDGPATGGVARSIDSGVRTSFHGTSRPQVVEREAKHRAISHAEIVGVPIMIVHVSGREAMEQARWARQRSLPVHAETCPQYVTLTADDLKGLNMDMRSKVCLLAAAARQGKLAGDLGGDYQRRLSDVFFRSLPVSV